MHNFMTLSISPANLIFNRLIETEAFLAKRQEQNAPIDEIAFIMDEIAWLEDTLEALDALDNDGE